MARGISREELLDEIHRLQDELGRVPRLADMREHGKYSNSPYNREFGSWTSALEAAGYKPNTRQTVTDTELIENLRKITEELGHPPTRNEADVHGDYGTSTYEKRFGGWTSALKEADIDLPDEDYRIPTAELLEEVARVADVVDGNPTIADIDTSGEYSYETYRQRFGSWTKALREAGYEPEHHSNIPEHELLEELRHVYAELGRTPTQIEMRECSDFSERPYIDKFGSWNDALRRADIPIASYGEISEDDLLDEVRRLRDKLDRVPTLGDLQEHGQYSYGPYYSTFGGWINTLQKLNYELPVAFQDVPEEELLKEIDRLAEKLDRPPKLDDVHERGKYPASRYRVAFGTWNNALKQAGYELNEESGMSNSALLGEIERLKDELGHVPVVEELHKHGKYSYPTYVDRFESWPNAVKTAGYTPSHEVNIPTEKLLKELRQLGDRLNRIPSAMDVIKHSERGYNTYTSRFDSWIDVLEAAGYDIDLSDHHTDIERIGMSILDTMGVNYEPFAPIGPFEVDALVNQHAVIIEWDGEYWHGHPDTRPFDDIQRQVKETDTRKNRHLIDNNYTVIRVWGSTLRNHPDTVQQKLTDYLATAPFQDPHVHRLEE